MLISTYALVTLQTERKIQLGHISQIRELLERPAAPSKFWWENLIRCMEVLVFEAELRFRQRFEECFFPLLRLASNDCVDSLSMFAQLQNSGREITLRFDRMLVDFKTDFCTHRVETARATVRAYCQNLLERLDYEEDELLPLARRCLRHDAWFNVGARFLVDDNRRLEATTVLRLPIIHGNKSSHYIKHGSRIINNIG